MLILCQVNLLNYHVYVVYDFACSGCAVATRDKTVMLGLRILVLLTLHTLLNTLVCCLQLNAERGTDAIWKMD